jgi:outer membrane protein OmpA-like peptidoglycan-associated protein
VLGATIARGGKTRDEAEKPFWISYADLMTALMVLFLVVMSVALLAVTKTVDEAAQRKQTRDTEIKALLDDLEAATDAFGIKLDRARQAVDFGDKATFQFNSSELTTDQERQLREFVPDVLRIALTERGQRWLKRVVIEGFTDQKGTYLYNLNLSLQRSQRVLCALLAPPQAGEIELNVEQKENIRSLFLVGGYSFNSAKATPEASRRIELRLEFYGLDEGRSTAAAALPAVDVGVCAMR